MRSTSRTLLAGVAAAATLAGLAACSPPSEEPAGDLTLTVAAPFGLSTDYDPRVGGLDFGFEKQGILEPLAVWNQTTNSYDPVLATDWTISEDRLSMTMNLREDVDFSDGTHMDAEAVETFFDALFASGTYGFTPRIVNEYGTEFTATGEYTVEVTTTSPIAWPWFEHMSYTPVISPAALDDPEALAKGPVGVTGAYEITEFVTDVELTMERRSDYWNADAYPYQTVVLKVFDDEVAALNALKTGQVDAIQLGGQLAVEAEAAGFKIFTGNGMERMLFISDRAGEIIPALGDVRVRQAMNLAFDKQAILETIDLGYGTASSQPYLSVQAEFVADGEDRYAYDLDEARRLMEEAGFEEGFAITLPSYPGLTDIEPIVQQSLADINITVTYEQFPDVSTWYPAVGAGITAGKYPVVLHYDYPISLARDWLLPSGTWAGAGYSSPEVDSLLETIRTGTEEESAEASQELGEFILEEAWFVPISKPSVTWATIPEIDMVVGDVNAIPQLLSFVPAG